MEELGSARSNKLCDLNLRSNTHDIGQDTSQNLGDIQLADSKFYESQPVDLLTGSDY